METNKPKISSPRGSEVDRSAFDTPIHQIGNNLKRKHMTTTRVDTIIEEHESNGTHQRWTEHLTKKHNADQAVQQEAKEQEIREAPLSISTFSLAHQGRFSRRPGIPYFTAEKDHDAVLTAITGEEERVFVCRINIWLKDTAEVYTGVCRVPIAEMDKAVVDFCRKRPKWVDGVELKTCLRQGSSG